ncbi:MAG: A/G-specific adenine glycosylase [Gammaproteobacteria bacterium]|jgi:A/G-specific adenine glycosylase|nr:A/G-specific adenine glycosylase [Gammaproteobacteria bacterium]MDP6096798.1 A/G-specific adenine glycosylase [Gammaproteobacteria bacterium]HJO11951.1 A/G-specific adenine glycosylase [Gammaproteobacteria bacterium]
MIDFANQVLDWFQQHGRHDLPWQQNPTPYRVWVSEIMLQQTQVSTVIPYYLRFMARFPSVTELASAHIDQVLHLWTGLGYYARARNLHKSAKTIEAKHQGSFPTSIEELMQLDGLGRSTAGAIAAIAMQIRAPILDGNVKRVLTRYHTIEGWPERASIKRQLWEIAECLTPQNQVAEYTQAIMDLGATVCTRSNPSCIQCPLQTGCKAFTQGNPTDYPGKKPKKILPVRSATLLILLNPCGEVLLEKRPPTGIWGSLWSLPEIKSAGKEFDIRHCSIEYNTREELPGIRHTFSHFHLDITPIKLRARQINDEVAESGRWLWYPLDQSIEVGLAAPVKKLLTTLTE